MDRDHENDTLDFLIAQVCHTHYSRMIQLLEGLGLYRGQPIVIDILWEKEGITQVELARKMKNSSATVTKMLQRMEKAGFVQRKLDPKDQRISRVYLTDAGRDIKKEIELIHARMENEAFQNFTEEERQIFRSYLIRLLVNMQNALDHHDHDCRN